MATKVLAIGGAGDMPMAILLICLTSTSPNQNLLSLWSFILCHVREFPVCVWIACTSIICISFESRLIVSVKVKSVYPRTKDGAGYETLPYSRFRLAWDGQQRPNSPSNGQKCSYWVQNKRATTIHQLVKKLGSFINWTCSMNHWNSDSWLESILITHQPSPSQLFALKIPTPVVHYPTWWWEVGTTAHHSTLPTKVLITPSMSEISGHCKQGWDEKDLVCFDPFFSYHLSRDFIAERTEKREVSYVNCCAYNCGDGKCFWSNWTDDNYYGRWGWQEQLNKGGTIRMVLDLDEGILTIHKDGR